MASSDEFRDQASRLFSRLEDEIVELFEAAVKESEGRADEAEGMAAQREEEAQKSGRLANIAYDLLGDLAEDRHNADLVIDGEPADSGHRGTLRTCPDRLCQEAAALLKSGG